MRERILIGVLVLAVIALVLSLMTGGELSVAARDLGSNSKERRLAAVNRLIGIGGEDAAAILAPYVDDKDREIAFRVIDGLGRMETQTYRNVITKALKHDRADMRQAAIVAIARYGRAIPENQQIIAAIQEDRSAEVRAAAAKVMGRNRVWEAMPALVAAMRDKSVAVRASASESVFKMLGARFNFKPTDPNAKREPAVKFIESIWKNPRFKEAHDAFIQRMENRS